MQTEQQATMAAVKTLQSQESVEGFSKTATSSSSSSLAGRVIPANRPESLLTQPSSSTVYQGYSSGTASPIEVVSPLNPAAAVAATQLPTPSSTIEENKDISENDRYVLYMKQIKVREAEKAFVGKIHKFFEFMRQRALFANATLLNFWNSTRQFNLPQFYHCAILFCLCSYYYNALNYLRQILTREID